MIIIVLLLFTRCCAAIDVKLKNAVKSTASPGIKTTHQRHCKNEVIVECAFTLVIEDP